MRVLISAHGASLFGAERVLLAQAAGLAARGHDVTVEFPQEGPAVALARTLPGVQVWVSGRPRLPRTVWELLRYLCGAPGAVWRLARHVRSACYDVVWVHTVFNPLPAMAGCLVRVPVVWHAHERNFGGVAGHVQAALMRVMARVPVALSAFTKATFERSGWLRGRVVALFSPLTNEIAPRTAPGGTSRFTIGYIGQLEPRKRAQDVPAALALLMDARAVLVGDGKARASVAAVVASVGVSDRCTLAGFQPDVRPFLTTFDVLVMPAQDEPWGLVVMEAMAAGVPVVAADSGSLREVLGDAALYYPLGDREGLARQLQHLRTDASLRQALVVRGLRRVEEFRLPGWLDRVEAILGEATQPVDRPSVRP